MLQWKPRFAALATVLALAVAAYALGFVVTPFDLFW
jgi:hypothetical protein